MLAARDQENLVHAQQTAGASKPLNQGIRHLLPKTPNAKAPKTPFKVSLNDENAPGGGRIGLKANGKGNENNVVGRKTVLGTNNAFVTPMGPRIRAPLGQKTTNAKTRPFQIPADIATKQHAINSISARKPKLKPGKTDVASIQDILNTTDDAELPEAEYMPPRSVPLPDYPDDIHELDFTPVDNREMISEILQDISEQRGEDGLTRYEREKLQSKRAVDYICAKGNLEDEKMLREREIPCIHGDECEGICPVNGDRQEKAQEWYWVEKEKIDQEYKDVQEQQARENQGHKKRQERQEAKAQVAKDPITSLSSASAASALSQKPSPAQISTKVTIAPAAKKPPLPSYMLPTRAKIQTAVPPPSLAASAARHRTAVAASRTTMGYAKGRSTSAALRGTVLPMSSTTNPPTDLKNMPLSNKTNTTRLSNKPPTSSSTSTTKKSAQESIYPSQRPHILPNGTKADMSLPPSMYIQRYGKPPQGSKMWMRCLQTGAFEEEPDLGDREFVFGVDGGVEEQIQPWEVEGALDDFQLEMPA